MKIYYTINGNVRSGYLNLAPRNCKLAGFEPCDPTEISNHVDDYEVEELIIENVLETIPIQDITKLLDLFINKLCKDGKIQIQSKNLSSICNAITYGKLNSEQVNNLLYNNYTISILQIQDLVNYFNMKQLKILHKSIDAFMFTISAQKV